MSDWALVCGAESGIGRALAVEAAKAGLNVILAGADEAKLRALADGMQRSVYVEAQVMKVDLGDPEVASRVWSAANKIGRVTVLVNGAGYRHAGRFTETRGWNGEAEVLAVNITAATLLMKRAAAGMAAQGMGRILNVVTAASFAPGPGRAVDHASRAYLLALSEAVAEEMRGTGVTVTALAAGTQEWGNGGAEGALLARLPVPDDEVLAKTAWKRMMKGRRLVLVGWPSWVMALAPRVLPRRMLTFLTAPLLRKKDNAPATR